MSTVSNSVNSVNSVNSFNCVNSVNNVNSVNSYSAVLPPSPMVFYIFNWILEKRVNVLQLRNKMDFYNLKLL